MSDTMISPEHSKNDSETSMRSPLERKETLRSFLTKTQALRSADKKTLTELEELIQATDDVSLEATIDDKVTCQDEVLMDSQIMTASSRVLRSATATLTKDLSPYDSREFVEKMLTYVHMLPDTTVARANWSILEADVTRMFKRTPNFSTLSGCLEPIEKKVTARRQPAKRDALAVTKRPEAIITLQNDPNSVEQTVEKAKHLISYLYKKTGQPIEYFRLVIHPQRFDRTVSNMLHVSFLVRDYLVKMAVDDKGTLVVMPTTKEMRAASKKSKNQERHQMIMTLDFEQWQALINGLGLKYCMLEYADEIMDGQTQWCSG